MAPHQTLFRRPCLEKANNFLFLVMSPQTTFINVMMTSLRLTSEEREKRESEDPCYERYVILSFLLPMLLIFSLIYLPVFSIAFIFWAPLQRHRRPYRLKVSENIPCSKDGLTDSRLTVVSIDTQLLPEYMARVKNLSHTQKRAMKISQSITPETCAMKYTSETIASTEDLSETNQDEKLINKNNIFKIQEEFPCNADVVCFQGVYDWRAERKLVDHLCKHFPNVICDVTHNAWSSNRFRLGSGLVLATRLPVSEADFRYFEQSSGDDKIKAKGFLIVKVNPRESTGQEQTNDLTVVNTELQEGNGPEAVTVRTHQLSQLQRHLAECEGVKFVCGNFHLDNASVDEKSNWTHPIFDDVIDPCAHGQGADHQETIGTELKQWKIYSDDISTPVSMKRTLETVEGQRRFLKMVPAPSSYGAMGPTPSSYGATVPTRGSYGGADCPSYRRTSRIMYNKHSGPTLELRKYMFVTKLACLTTHLALGAEFVWRRAGGYISNSKDVD